MKKLSKFFNALLAVTLLATPFVLTAKHSHSSHSHSSEDCHEEPSIKKIRYKDVVGFYQISGFSNNLNTSGTLEQPQSQALVGQVELFKNGEGRIVFLDQSFIINDQLFSLHSDNIPLTYTLGPINGHAIAIVPDFPTVGTDLSFTISFKVHQGKVVGFSQLLTGSTTAFSRWTLIQGERFN